jgi:hypothetical protein
MIRREPPDEVELGLVILDMFVIVGLLYAYLGGAVF